MPQIILIIIMLWGFVFGILGAIRSPNVDLTTIVSAIWLVAGAIAAGALHLKDKK